jgi:hypothetical protein
MSKSRPGGKRPGAGRPVTIGASVRVTLTLTPDDVAALKSISPNLSEAVRSLIREVSITPPHAHTQDPPPQRDEGWAQSPPLHLYRNPVQGHASKHTLAAMPIDPYGHLVL